MSTEGALIAYCGTPPVPAELWSRWNFDPVLIATALLVCVAYARGWRRSQNGDGRAPSVRNAVLFFSGWLVAVLAVTSPLCALSVALFSARAAQHVILAALAAPLIILGRPGAALAEILPRPAKRLTCHRAVWRVKVTAPFAWSAFAMSLWLWHAPGPYDGTFLSPVLYWAMHISTFGSALLLWRALLGDGNSGAVSRVACGFTTGVHMGLLGALLTLSPRPLYRAHAETTAQWGLNALTDQQLGGVIMWVPGCSLLLITALLSMSALLRRAGEESSLGALKALPGRR